MSKRAGSLRDELITKAQYGKITPDEAEAQAKAAGLPPFETQPEFTEFDPMKESRWTLVMAIAWIAWRDAQLVMEQGAEFCRQSYHWIYREWTEPVDGGRASAQREGWFLEQWEEATVPRLTFLETWMKESEELPSSAQLTPGEAQKELWRALAEEKLSAEGFNSSRQLVTIPAREWVHLRPFEAHNRDVLRYDGLDRREPYTEVRFRRVDLIRLWPPQPDPAVDNEAACVEWLKQQMNDSPDRKRWPKAKYQSEALERFSIGKNKFLRAWEKAVRETGAYGWSRAGRPSSKIKSPR